MDINITNKNEKPLDNILPDGGYTAIFRTICCIGDSLSSGEFEAVDENGEFTYHDMYEYSWGQFISRMCGSKVYNFSRGGMTAKEYCESFADNNSFWSEKFAAQAYIIALGVNDVNQKQDIGTLADIDFNNWRNNKKNFAGYYSQIIQRLKEIQPKAKFFLMTMPSDGADDIKLVEKKKHRELLYSLADKFDSTYVIDLFEYAPEYNKEFKEIFYLQNHMNPMGYLLTAKMVASYIDYIIRNNIGDFKEVGFIGTQLHS